MCYQHFGAVPQIQLTNTFLNDKALCFICRTFYNLKKKQYRKCVLIQWIFQVEENYKYLKIMNYNTKLNFLKEVDKKGTVIKKVNKQYLKEVQENLLNLQALCD